MPRPAIKPVGRRAYSPQAPWKQGGKPVLAAEGLARFDKGDRSGERGFAVHMRIVEQHRVGGADQRRVGAARVACVAGVDVGDRMIGENLLDVVEKKNDNRANEVFAQISESRCGRCIRTADYMYSVYAPGVNGGEAAASDVYADDFLYDMKKDPWQLNNVVADPAYAEVKAELRERLLNWIERAEGARPTITD